MHRVPPGERLSCLRFPAPSSRLNPDDPPIHEIPNYTVFQCRCGLRIQLQPANFVEAAVHPKTRLSPEDSKAADRAAERSGPADSFLDWYCPGCGAAARVYFAGGVADKGIFFVEVGDVVESA